MAIKTAILIHSFILGEIVVKTDLDSDQLVHLFLTIA